MCPTPELTMPIATVMPLHPKPQRITLKAAAIEGDLPRKKCVRMWRSREANPALAAQRDAKRGVKSQVPGNRVSLYFQRSSAGVLLNLIVSDSEMEWISPSGAHFDIRQRKSLNKALWLSIFRKPCGPKLERHSPGVSRTTPSPRIHQQIPKPPGTAAIRQTHANEPDFITAASRQRGKYFVQRLRGV